MTAAARADLLGRLRALEPGLGYCEDGDLILVLGLMRRLRTDFRGRDRGIYEAVARIEERTIGMLLARPAHGGPH